MEKRKILLKVLLTAIMFTVLASLICGQVYAGQSYDVDVSNKISGEIEALEDVDKAVVIVYKKYAIVGIKANPFYFSNQKSGLIEKIKKIVLDNSKAAEVLVSTDIDIMLKVEKIKKGLDSGESKFSMKKDIKDLYKLFKERGVLE